MFKKPFSGSRQAEDASYYGAGLVQGSPDPFDHGPGQPVGIQALDEADPDSGKPAPQGQARSMSAPAADDNEAAAGDTNQDLPAPGGEPPAPPSQGPVAAAGDTVPEAIGPAAPLQPIGAALMPASGGDPSQAPSEPADVPPIEAGGPVGAPSVGGAIAGPSHFADDLGWTDALWGDDGGFEAILRGVLDGGPLTYGVDGPSTLNVFVENLDVDLFNVIQNTLVQNTTILFDASEGGSIDVDGDVTALGLQTADADQMMAFL